VREGRLFISVVFSGLCLAAKDSPGFLASMPENLAAKDAPGFLASMLENLAAKDSPGSFLAAKVLTRRVRGHTHQGKPRNSQNHSLYTSDWVRKIIAEGGNLEDYLVK